MRSAFRRIADPQGRLDDTFVYTRGVSIHPHVFRSSLGQYRPIVEYQVRQTERGPDIRVAAEAQVDTALIEHTIGQALAALGLDQPEVTITLEPALDRQAETLRSAIRLTPRSFDTQGKAQTKRTRHPQ